MKITWKNISNNEVKEINSWLSGSDKHNLCMTTKTWQQTALDIEECINIMPNAQFKNVIGYVNNEPVVACMFAVEHIGALNLYNIVVNPKFRGMGIAKYVVTQLVKNNKSFNLIMPYNKVIMSALPQNTQMINLLQSLNFSNLGFNGEYVEFEKEVQKNIEKTC